MGSDKPKTFKEWIDIHLSEAFDKPEMVWNAAVNECCEAVLNECPECGGSGTITPEIKCRHCVATIAAIRERTGVKAC